MSAAPVWPTGGGGNARNLYVQRRVGQRMTARGEPMTLRTVNKLPGPVPYTYPPDVSADLVVATGVIATDGNPYLGLTGSVAIGRLIAGDQIMTGPVTWTVLTMPTGILTNSDGIPIADGAGNPAFGTPMIYWPDSLAANDAWTVIPVSAPDSPNPAASIGQSVSFIFASDQIVYGRVLTLEEMTRKGWTQVNTIGVNIAAINGATMIDPPAVDDLIWINGQQRSIMAVGQIFRDGVNFVYSLQCN